MCVLKKNHCKGGVLPDSFPVAMTIVVCVSVGLCVCPSIIKHVYMQLCKAICKIAVFEVSIMSKWLFWFKVG